jgi:hypothetical protein
MSFEALGFVARNRRVPGQTLPSPPTTRIGGPATRGSPMVAADSARRLRRCGGDLSTAYLAFGCPSLAAGSAQPAGPRPSCLRFDLAASRRLDRDRLAGQVKTANRLGAEKSRAAQELEGRVPGRGAPKRGPSGA